MIKRFNSLIAASVMLAVLLTVMPSYTAFASENNYHGDIRWDFVTDEEGFTPANATIEGVNNGVLTVKSTTGDPQLIVGNQNIAIDEYRYIRVRMKDYTASGEMTFYFFEETGYSNFLQLSLTRERCADSDFVEYVAELDDAVLANGIRQEIYKRFRFDFITNITGGTADIDYIILSKYPEVQTTEVIENVLIGGTEVNNFEADGEYIQTEIYSDIYENLSAKDVMCTVGESFLGAELSVKVKDITDRKIVDITVNGEDFSRNYRIVCKEKELFPADIRWDFEGDSEAFICENAVINGVADGCLDVSPENNSDDPRIIAGGVAIKMNAYKYLRVRLKDNSDSAYMQFYLLEDNGYNNRLCYTLKKSSASADSDFKEYVIPLEDFTPEVGSRQEQYSRLRFDFMNLNGENKASTGNVLIDYIIISGSDGTESFPMISSVFADGEELKGFSTLSENEKGFSKAEIYDDVFENLSAESIKVVLTPEYENSVVKVNISETGSVSGGTEKKYADITVTALLTSAARCYRIVFSPKVRPGAVNNYPGDLRWDFTTDTEGFVASNAIINSIENGIMKVSTDNSKDPQILVEGQTIDINEYKYIRVRMKDCSKSPNMQFYLLEAGGYNNRLMLDLKKPAAADSDFKIYTGKISNAVLEGGTTKHDVYNRFRFDFMNGVTEGYAEIDYIIFSKYEVAPETQMISSVMLGDNTIKNFDSKKDYFEAVIYDDIYNSLAENSVALTFGSGYENSSISVKVKNITNRKVVDISVNKDRFSRSYRIVCEAAPRPAGITVTGCDISEYTVNYSGTLKNDKGDAVVRPVTVLVYEKGKEINYGTIEYMDVVMPSAEGLFEGSIMLYDEEATARNCELEILFDVLGEDKPVLASAKYINNTSLDESTQSLKNNTESGVLDFMSQNSEMYERMGVWLSLYDSLNQELKKQINESIEKYRSDITRETASEIANGSILAILSKGLAAKDLKVRIGEFDSEVKTIEVEDTNFGKLSEEDSIWVCTNVISNMSDNGYDDWKVFYNDVREAMFLNIINDAAYTKISDLILNNTDIVGEISVLKNETNSEIVKEAMRSIAKQADKEEFTKASDLVDFVEKAIKEAKNTYKKENSSGGSYSGGGGTGGGTNTYRTSGTQIQLPGNETAYEKEIFNDLSGFEWAEKAITELYGKGIVSGNGSEGFEPARYVTREEFTKLICEAFKLGKGEVTTEFTDVNEADWFAGYVSRAVELGIIKGKSENRFGSGEMISREDMAVIIYRTLEYKNTELGGQNSNFSDYDEISEYAVEAVEKLCAKGIVNGKENGRFAPKDSATRAEAAVIIFRCTEKFSL